MISRVDLAPVSATCPGAAYLIVMDGCVTLATYRLRSKACLTIYTNGQCLCLWEVDNDASHQEGE